jgi:hypothetical protein
MNLKRWLLLASVAVFGIVPAEFGAMAAPLADPARRHRRGCLHVPKLSGGRTPRSMR